MDYIDRDTAIRTATEMCVKIVGHGITQIDAVNIADAFEDVSTADVVPKSEVEKLQKELEIWKQNRFNLFQRLGCYEMAKQKIVSEIFEEIETIVDNNTYKSYLPNSPLWSKEYKIKQIITELAELKKKYTEGEQ